MGYIFQFLFINIYRVPSKEYEQISRLAILFAVLLTVINANRRKLKISMSFKCCFLARPNRILYRVFREQYTILYSMMRNTSLKGKNIGMTFFCLAFDVCTRACFLFSENVHLIKKLLILEHKNYSHIILKQLYTIQKQSYR